MSYRNLFEGYGRCSASHIYTCVLARTAATTQACKIPHTCHAYIALC